MPKPKALTPEEIAALHAQHLAGASCRKLARKAGIAHVTLSRYFHDNALEVIKMRTNDDAIDPNISVYIRPTCAKWLSKIAKILNYDHGISGSGNSAVARAMLDWIQADETRLRHFIADTLEVPLS